MALLPLRLEPLELQEAPVQAEEGACGMMKFLSHLGGRAAESITTALGFVGVLWLLNAAGILQPLAQDVYRILGNLAGSCGV